jgi:phenylalanyl-tRNA synthetase alpha chain
MKEELEEIRRQAMAELGAAAGAKQIEDVRVRMLGRSGELTAIMRGLRDVAPENRPAMGQLANEIKREIEARIEELTQQIARLELDKSLTGERIDVTLPGAKIPRGRLHPITIVGERMLDIFQ